MSPDSRFLLASRNLMDQPEHIELAMPSRRCSSAMLSVVRKPSGTMQIFSSAEDSRRAAWRMCLIAISAYVRAGPDIRSMFMPQSYDELAILPL